MPLTEQLFTDLIFMRFLNSTRFTQDSPVYPDVWMEYFKKAHNLKDYRADLILTPHTDSSAAELFKLLDEGRRNLKPVPKMSDWKMASSGESVVACLTFFELIRIVLPLTKWWANYLWKNKKPTPDQLWLIDLAGALLFEKTEKADDKKYDIDEYKKLSRDFRSSFSEHFQITKPNKASRIALWSVSRNRSASIAIEKSVCATKADAGRRLFQIDGSNIAWAVLDTGIDIRHAAFRKNDLKMKPFKKPLGTISNKASNQTRVVASYDFTKFREILVSIYNDSRKVTNITIDCTSNEDDQALNSTIINDYIKEIDSDLKNGRMLDWTILGPLLRIPHNEPQYTPPQHPHGTHVAGILGAGSSLPGDVLMGMCPAINLYDIRVMDSAGRGEEFNILAAMQFVRWLNSQKEGLIIHGANLSFSMIHEVESYACGQTPVCVAAEKMVADGMVVVAAAGNLGQAMFQSPAGSTERGFRMVNITDPGNAEDVITVGATHRSRPHTYGVSYFSSKGPTGDGRLKPDLVAPGEKIVSSTINNSTERMDGTSMAAPHVSGAAALLLARNRELIGRPRKVKEILCKTATDLGREKYFQGCGMVDVLRAIQSV